MICINLTILASDYSHYFKKIKKLVVCDVFISDL